MIQAAPAHAHPAASIRCGDPQVTYQVDRMHDFAVYIVQRTRPSLDTPA